MPAVVTLAAIVFLAVSAVLLGGVIAYFLFANSTPSSAVARAVPSPSPRPILAAASPVSNEIPATTPIPATPTPAILQSENEVMVVPPGQYNYRRFVVRQDAMLNGRYGASGGSGNDIGVFVYDDVEFAKFASHNPAIARYTSNGFQSSGIVSIRLRPGAYYLVFDNRKSIITSKNVSANFSLEY